MVHQVPEEAGGVESRTQVELVSEGRKDTYFTVNGEKEEKIGADRSRSVGTVSGIGATKMPGNTRLYVPHQGFNAGAKNTQMYVLNRLRLQK